MRKQDIEVGGEYVVESRHDNGMLRVRVVKRGGVKRSASWVSRQPVQECTASHTIEVLEVLRSGMVGTVRDPETGISVSHWGLKVGAMLSVPNRLISEPFADAVRQRMADEDAAEKAEREERDRVADARSDLDARAKRISESLRVWVRGGEMCLHVTGEDMIARVLDLLEGDA